MKKELISNIFVDLKTRTSKLEQKFFLFIVNEIEKNLEKIDEIMKEGINIVIDANMPFSLEEFKLAMNGLSTKRIEVYYTYNEERCFFSFNYISSYFYSESRLNIRLPLEIINSLKKNTLEYDISLRTFFYLRKKSLVKFFNTLIENIGQSREINISLIDLKEIFQISEEAYERFFDLEKNFLKPLVEKINLHSNFFINYEKIKKGESKNNRVVAINFKINNIEIEKNRGETNYLTQIIKNMITDYQSIWEAVNASIQSYGFEATKRNILFLKENGLEISDNDIKNYLKNNGRNIEEILKISNHILIKEKYSIYRDLESFIKVIYDIIIGYDFYYSLNFNFLNIIKNYKEGENLYYKDSTYVIFGYYKNNKGFLKIFEAKDERANTLLWGISPISLYCLGRNLVKNSFFSLTKSLSSTSLQI